METTRTYGRYAGILALVLAMVISFMPAAAYGKTKKVTVSKQSESTSVSVISKKAKQVKKGTTKITYKKGQGYIKFKAPATKTYKFTFSNVKGGKYSWDRGEAFVSVQKQEEGTTDAAQYVAMKTSGGSTSTLYLGVNGYKNNSAAKKDKPLAKRTGSIKLEKGEWVYLHFYSRVGGKTTAKLVIK